MVLVYGGVTEAVAAGEVLRRIEERRLFEARRLWRKGPVSSFKVSYCDPWWHGICTDSGLRIFRKTQSRWIVGGGGGGRKRLGHSGVLLWLVSVLWTLMLLLKMATRRH